MADGDGLTICSSSVNVPVMVTPRVVDDDAIEDATESNEFVDVYLVLNGV